MRDAGARRSAISLEPRLFHTPFRADAGADARQHARHYQRGFALTKPRIFIPRQPTAAPASFSVEQLSRRARWRAARRWLRHDFSISRMRASSLGGSRVDGFLPGRILMEYRDTYTRVYSFQAYVDNARRMMTMG